MNEELLDLDDDGYPTEALLSKVRLWPWQQGFAPLLDLVKANWNWGEQMFTNDGNRYAVSTGGWSGNEDLIEALQNNTMFWALCWVSSRRGGHYEFEVKE